MSDDPDDEHDDLLGEAPRSARAEASRANARWSTGPKTRAGKTRAARNAIRHGLRSVVAVLDGENEPDFASLLADLEREHAATTRVQQELVRELAVVLWRLRRCRLIESAVLAARRAEVEIARADDDGMRAAGALLTPRQWPGDTFPSDRKAHAAALTDLDAAWARAREGLAVSGAAFELGASSLLTLARYEAALDRRRERILVSLRTAGSFGSGTTP